MSRALSVCHGSFGRATLYELDRPLTRHAHREAHLIFFLGGSAGQVRVRHQQVVPGSSVAVAVNPWEAHDFLPLCNKAPGHYLIFYFNPAWLTSHMPEPVDPSCIFAAARIGLTAPLKVMRDQICHHLVQGTGDGALLEQHLLALLRTFDTRLQSGQVLQRQKDHSNAWAGLDFRVRKSIAALSPVLPLTFNLGRLARECGLSRAHFFKLFREQTGVTPVVYVNTLRIETALHRIARPDISITEIGDGLGFSCQSAFTRFFAANVGMAPSDYRRAIHITDMPLHA
jgi:AraC-like DNA-binding protein